LSREEALTVSKSFHPELWTLVLGIESIIV